MRGDARRSAGDALHRLECAGRLDDRDDSRAARRDAVLGLERVEQFVDRFDVRRAAHLRQHDAVHARGERRTQIGHKRLERPVRANEHLVPDGGEAGHRIGESVARGGLPFGRHAVFQIENQCVGIAAGRLRDEARHVSGYVEQRAPDRLVRCFHV